MPIVPTINQPSVKIDPASNTFQNVPGATPDAFGAGIGRATESVGKSLQGAGANAASVANDIQNLSNERESKRQFLDYGAAAQKIKSEYYSSTGQNTLDSYSGTLKSLDALGKKYVDSAGSNPVVSNAIQLAIQQDRLQFQKLADKHYSDQGKAVDDEQYNALIADAKNDGISEYKSFGADVSQFDESFDGDAANAFDDKVRVNENAIRRLARDKARKDGELPAVKEQEAVTDYYDSVVRAAVADGEPTTALRIFNGSRDKVTGDKGIKLKNFLKNEATDDIAFAIAREKYEGVSHLPSEQRLGAGIKEIRKITDRATFVSARVQFKAMVETDNQIKALEVPAAVRDLVMGMLKDGKSPAKASLELNKIKDRTKRDAALGFLKSVEEINKSAKKKIVEDFVGSIYRTEEDNVEATRTTIKKTYKGDSSAQDIALAHLKSLADVDESLLKTDLASQADKAKKEIIEKVRKTLPAGASVAEQKSSAILEAENIKKAEVKLKAIAQLNSFYSSLEGFDTELAQDAGADLIDKVSKTNKTGEEKLRAVLKSDTNSKTKKSAIAFMTSIDAAARRDEKVAMDNAKAAMSAAIAKGQSPSEFRASSPENAALYDLATSDGSYYGGAVAAFKLVQEGQEYPFVSHKSAVDEIRKMSEDELVRLDPEVYRGRLSRADTFALDARKRGAVAKRKTENARLLNRVSRLVKQFQLTDSKNKPRLTREELAEVDNFVWQQIDDAQKEGKVIDEQSVREMVIGAFVKVEFDPDDPAFFSLERFFGRGGGAKDVAGILIRDMSAKELETLRVDADDFPRDLDGFLEDFVEDWKFKNTGEPDEDDLELLRGDVLKELLKVERENK